MMTSWAPKAAVQPKKFRARTVGPGGPVATVLLAILLLSSAIGSSAVAEDWPRFRGPSGAGIAGDENLPIDFTPEDALWQQEVPFGRSSPIVVDHAVFLTGAADDELVTVALDAASGELLWRRSLPRLRRDEISKATGPSVATPVSDGRSLFVFFPEFGIAAYDLEGEERWRHELPPFDNFYGLASSPILEGDVLILQCDQQRSPFLVAFHKKNGEMLWRKDRRIGESWSTPVVQHPGSDSATLITVGTSKVDGYSVRTGEHLFSVGGVGYAPVASPILDGNRLYLTTPDGGGDAPIPSAATARGIDANQDGVLQTEELAQLGLGNDFGWLDRDGDQILRLEEYDEAEKLWNGSDFGVVAIDLEGEEGPAVAWRERRAVPYVATPILHRGVLFVVKDGGILTSFDAETGEVLKRGRIEGAAEPFFPSPVIADDRLFLPSSSGSIAVVSAEAEWELLSLSDLDEPIDASPAVADGRIFFRTRQRLLAFGGDERN